MTSIEIPDINFNTEIPSSFDEMGQKSFVRFVKLYIDLLADKISLFHLKTEMVFELLEIKQRWRIELLDEDQRTKVFENVYRIAEKIDFLFEEIRDPDSGKIHLKVNFPWTKFHIKNYRGYLGPDDILSDLNFLEYKNAHVAAAEFLQSEDPYDLDWFCTILYRKPRLSISRLGIHGKKPKYDEFKTRKHVGRFSGWPFPVKYAILIDFLACEEYIRTGTFKIDNYDVCFDVLFSNSSNSSGKIETGLTSVLFNLAESGVFGNIEATSEQNLFDVLYKLYLNHIQYESAKSRSK